MKIPILQQIVQKGPLKTRGNNIKGWERCRLWVHKRSASFKWVQWVGWLRGGGCGFGLRELQREGGSGQVGSMMNSHTAADFPESPS